MYGDHLLCLLRSVSEKKEYDEKDFQARFKTMFNPETYKGHLSHAIKGKLAQLAENPQVADVAEAITDTNFTCFFAPLLLVYKTRDDLLPVARAAASFCSRNPTILMQNDFFVDVFFKVLDGQAPAKAIERVVGMKPYSDNPDIAEGVKRGLASVNEDTTKAIAGFGQACDTKYGFPSAIHLLAKYENDLAKAIIANTQAGGDSCARGCIVATILAAHLGSRGLPPYTTQFKAFDEISSLLSRSMR